MAAIVSERCRQHCQASREKILHPRNSGEGVSLCGLVPKAEANNLCSRLLMSLLSQRLFFATSLKTKKKENLRRAAFCTSIYLNQLCEVCLSFLERISEALYVVSAACANMSACLTPCRGESRLLFPAAAAEPQARRWGADRCILTVGFSQSKFIFCERNSFILGNALIGFCWEINRKIDNIFVSVYHKDTDSSWLS